MNELEKLQYAYPPDKESVWIIYSGEIVSVSGDTHHVVLEIVSGQYEAALKYAQSLDGFKIEYDWGGIRYGYLYPVEIIKV